jgi:hypothetical protein
MKTIAIMFGSFLILLVLGMAVSNGPAKDSSTLTHTTPAHTSLPDSDLCRQVRHEVEYMVVTGVIGDWSLYQIGLSKEQLDTLMPKDRAGRLEITAQEAFPYLKRDLRMENLKMALAKYSPAAYQCVQDFETPKRLSANSYYKNRRFQKVPVLRGADQAGG